MERLLYISTARKAATAELDAILAVSRRNNAAIGITGLLITGGRRFLQVLEGPAPAVKTIFGRIERDPRHFAIVVLEHQPIQERSFGDWSMGHVAGAADGGPLEQLLAPIDDLILRAYFDGFVKQHAAA